jgi:diacylglycerol kinase
MQGLQYAFKYEQNIVIHLIITVLVICLGLYVNLNFNEWIFIILLIGLVVATELINTSIEAVVDLACTEIHPLAKVAKDTAAASVLIFALTSVVAGGLIFVPKIIEILF